MYLMRNAVLIFVWLAAVTAPAQPTPGWKICRNPVRVFPGRATVDLTPLFLWWSRQPLVVTNKSAGADTNAAPAEERPLAAWSRVTGTKLATSGSSWLVQAVIHASPTEHTNARIILNNPPAVEEAAYDTLKAQRADVEQRMVAARRDYDANTNAEAKAQQQVERYRRSWSKVASDGVIAYTRIAVQRHNSAAAALSQWDRLALTRHQIDAQLAAIPASNGVYQIDWFAVLLGKTKGGVPVYDLGLVSATPP
jgi:hypothetical protein